MAWRGGLCASAALLWVLATPGRDAAFADTPGFECAGAKAPVELLICGNDDPAQAGSGLADPVRLAEATPSPALQTPAQESLPTALGLERATLPASGEHSTLLSVVQFGRYSISVASDQGVALQLVDRMTGPGDIEGAPGERDGRIDGFLDRGRYKLLLRAGEHGSGEAALSVHPFAELNGPEIPRLPEIKQIDTDLGDYQQRSYWLEIKDRRVVAIEAAGRNLADMRLWRDGNWLVDAAPTAVEVEPEAGKPLAVRRIVATLEPGLYLLSAYGGRELAWAKTSDAHPLHLRLGIPTIADAGRQAFTTSPFGIDRYLVPATANFFRVELPEAEVAELFVRDYDEQQPFEPGPGTAITKQSLPPVAEISGSSRESGFKLVTVRREAGKPYVLQHFKSVSIYHFDGTGEYWIATLHSGYGEDNVDATGVLTERTLGSPEHVIDDNAPKLDHAALWLRRFNLLEPVTTFFHVTEAGGYVVTSSGANATYRFEPMIHFGIDYKAPEFQPSGYVWKLDPGYYVLTGNPESEGKGILDIRVAAEGVIGNGGDQAKETSVLFPSKELKRRFSYTLYLNRQPGVKAGVVLRRLPIDLQPGLPVVLRAGQSLDVPVTASRDGRVTAVAEDATAMPFTVDHGAAVTEWRGDGARHVLTLANTTDKALNAALRFMPDSLAPETPLPAVSADALQAIPNFPALPLQQPTYFDIAQDEHRTFALDVAEPGLYRVESSGLLQTEGAIRTRTVVSLDRAANNGTGRNFLLQQYLGQGSYQLSLAAQGETHGRMGVAAARTVLTDGGSLSPGVPARDTIAAGNGLVYRFTVSTAGRYRLQSLGLGRTYRMRLEDEDGWPIIPPNAPADVTMEFAAGNYRLVILPQPVDARIVTLLERLEEPVALEGHGPHDLALNRTQTHQWIEPDEGGERVPDRWRFRLPATAHVKIALSRGMRADLVAETEDAPKDIVTGGERWERELPAGTYHLNATTLEPNNRFDYSLSVTTTELLAGHTSTVTLPADVPLSLGSDSVVEIGSFGVTDVRAWLYDGEDRLVAGNDDRPNDWNFAITGRMRPGFYRLHLEAVGDAGANAAGQTTVSIYQAAEHLEPALAAGEDTELSGPDVHIVPLTARPGDLLVVAAHASGPAVGLGIERNENGTWWTLSERAGRSPWIAVPANRQDYRLRVWSIDRSTDPIRLQTRMVSPQSARQDQFLGEGVALQVVSGIDPALGVAAVSVDAAGAYRLAHPSPDLAWSAENGRALAGDAGSVVFGNKGTLWFGARLATGDESVAAKRVTLDETAAALTVPGADHGATLVADPAATGGATHLWLMESRLGQPGIGGKGLVGATARDSAIAVAPDTDQAGFALQLWNAGDPSSALPVTLQRIDFAGPGKETLGWGVADRALRQRQALLLTLPKGLKRLTLALPPQTAVILRDGKASDGIWSGDSALALTKDSTAEQLLVLPVAQDDGQLGVSLTSIARGDAMTALGGGRIFKQYFPADGVVRLNVRLSAREKTSGAKLMLAGNVQAATLIRDDGTVTSQSEPSLAGNAKLDIAHGAGLVVAWIDGGDPLTSVDVAAQATRVRQTSVVPLSGAAQQIVFAVKAQKFLRLKTTTPVIAQIGPAEGAQQLKVFADGADLNLLLPKGSTPLVLRAAADGPLSGVAEATLIDIAPIGEGLGPKARLTPGESRLYSFTIEDERDIGVGVRGSIDSAHCRVLDGDGNKIGAGVVQMLRLKPGTYLLAVDAPAEGTAIEVQPALVGIAAPDGSPPEDVKRAYLALAGLKPQQQE